MKTTDVPTASYYTATNSGWTPIIRLIAILGLIIAGFGLLQWTSMLLKLFPAFVGKAQPTELNGSWLFVSTIILSTWALLLASSIACLYRHDLGRRGMLLCAGLLLLGTVISANEVVTLGRGQYLFSKQPLPVLFYYTVSWTAPQLSSVFADAVFPLFVLTVFRLEGAKQFFFKQGT